MKIVCARQVDDDCSPVKVQHLKLRNDSNDHRDVSVTWFTELTLGEHRESSQMHVMTHWDNEARILLGYNFYHPEYGQRATFFAMTPKPTSYCGDRTVFLGRNRTLQDRNNFV